MAGPTLIITAVTPANTISLNLSSYLQLQPGTQMDPYNPAFTNKVFSHSLLKEGGTLALESLALKELQFPLRLKAASSTGLAELIQQLNQVLNSPGATASWQDEGTSQPTYFDLASGQFDLTYTFREAAQHFQAGLLRIFAQPLGRTAGPRAFAAASGVGPLLMISPYASGGALTIAASEQAGVKGYGGKQQPSGGVFYWGNPSLAGDVGSLLQISYVGPEPAGATSTGLVPNTVVSILPDQDYQPLYPTGRISVEGFSEGFSEGHQNTAIASSYFHQPGQQNRPYELEQVEAAAAFGTGLWAGNHRLFAIARASAAPAYLQTLQSAVVPYSTTATVYAGDWALYDLGVFTMRASEPISQNPIVEGVTASSTLDLTALVMLPDATTWYLSGGAIRPSQYGYPLPAEAGVAVAPYTNALLLDDVVGDQFVVGNTPATVPASPIGLVHEGPNRITQYSRGLVSRPDPQKGLPIIAILGVPQNSAPTITRMPRGRTTAGASWANPQNVRTMAQVAVLERFRYVSG